LPAEPEDLFQSLVQLLALQFQKLVLLHERAQKIHWLQKNHSTFDGAPDSI